MRCFWCSSKMINVIFKWPSTEMDEMPKYGRAIRHYIRKQSWRSHLFFRKIKIRLEKKFCFLSIKIIYLCLLSNNSKLFCEQSLLSILSTTVSRFQHIFILQKLGMNKNRLSIVDEKNVMMHGSRYKSGWREIQNIVSLLRN